MCAAAGLSSYVNAVRRQQPPPSAPLQLCPGIIAENAGIPVEYSAVPSPV